MEQLINAATPYYYIMIAFWAFGIGIICIGVIIFILSEMTAGKEAFFILILGVLFFIPGVHFGNIFGKYNDQIIAIVKPAISESYPNATDFSYCINKGSFTENDIEYKIQYQKTIKNEEKLIVTVKDELFKVKDKSVKTLDIPKKKSK